MPILLRPTSNPAYIFALLFVFGALIAGGCKRDRVIIEDEPFETGIVRLGDIKVASVDGTYIYMSDVERHAASQKLIAKDEGLLATDPRFQQVLDELIDQRLLSLDALRRSLDQRDEARRRLGVARERILGNIRIEDYLTETLTDEVLREKYNQQVALGRQGEEIRVRHILVQEEASAKSLAERLENGESFAELAKTYSDDSATKERGGDLGYITKDMLDPDFSAAVFALETGERSAPIKTQFGWHVAEVRDRRKAKAPSFEASRDEIAAFMTFENIQALLEELRQQGEVKLLLSRVPAPPDSNEAK